MHKMILIVALSFVCFSLIAQNRLELSYREAIELAQNQNVELQIRKNEQRVNQAEHQEARMRFLPNATLNTSVLRQIGQQFQAVEDRIVVTNIATDFVSASLGLNLDLYNGMSRKNTYHATKHRLLAQSETIKQTRLNIILEVSRQYLQVLLDKELTRIAEENIENQRKILQQIENFVRSGIRARPDLLSQKAELSRLELEWVNAEIQVENDLQLLAGTLQIDPGYTLDIKKIDGIELSAFNHQALTVEELFIEAKKHRPDLKSQSETLEAARYDVAAARGLYLPRVTAFYNFGTFFTSLDERSFSMQFTSVYPVNTFGIRVNVPIYSNHQNKTNVIRSEVIARNEELNSLAMERQLYQEIQSAYLNYKSSLKREEVSAYQLEAALENVKVQEERFRLGLNSIVEFAEANRMLVQARSDSAQALYSRVFSELILQYTLGVVQF